MKLFARISKRYAEDISFVYNRRSEAYSNGGKGKKQRADIKKLCDFLFNLFWYNPRESSPSRATVISKETKNKRVTEIFSALFSASSCHAFGSFESHCFIRFRTRKSFNVWCENSRGAFTRRASHTLYRFNIAEKSYNGIPHLALRSGPTPYNQVRISVSEIFNLFNTA